MNSTTHRPQSTAATLYVALELSRDAWLLTMSIGPQSRRQREQLPRPTRESVLAALTRAKARFGLSQDAAVRSCYEAGRDMFWPHWLLTELGVHNVVVDSSSIEVSRRARRAKTDRLDGEHLVRLLERYWGGETTCWHVVHVPAPAVEAARHASRALTALQKERTAYRNRIHGLLAQQGARVTLDATFRARLASVTDYAGRPLAEPLQRRMVETWELLQVVETLIRARRREERQRVRATAGAAAAPTRAQRLVRLRGIAARTATILEDELLSRELRNRRQVGALCGLVSVPYDSGTTRRDQGLARSGLPAIRRLAVEVAWLWLEYQPTSALAEWYRAKYGRGSAAVRRLGIVALARRLMIALWRYVDQGVPIPGAVLKSATPA